MANKKTIPSPPGGELVCGDEQMPIVKVINNQVFAECHSEPKNITKLWQIKDYRAFDNWVLSIVKAEKNRDLDEILTFDDIQILRTRSYKYHDFNLQAEVEVVFSFPRQRQRNI